MAFELPIMFNYSDYYHIITIVRRKNSICLIRRGYNAIITCINFSLIFGTDSRQMRSRSNSSRRIAGGGNEKGGSTANQPSASQHGGGNQQKVSNINHLSNGKQTQKPQTAELPRVSRTRMTSKSMRVKPTSLSSSSATKSKPSSSDAKQLLQRMYPNTYI